MTIAPMYSTGEQIVACIGGTWQLPLYLYFLCEDSCGGDRDHETAE